MIIKNLLKVTLLLISIMAFTFTTHADDPDYGIYWFDKGDVSKKAIRGESNPYYDRNKPTLIFTHGWQNGRIKRGTKFSFNYQKNEPQYGIDVNTADAWIDAGWNVGVFYWTPFADEPSPTDAEAKIWSGSSYKKMRYRHCDENGNNCSYKQFSTTNSVASLFLKSYKDALHDYRGNNIRLAGHSLGNQLVIRTAEKIRKEVNDGDMPERLFPERIALLDPYYTPFVLHAFTGWKTTSKKASEYMQRLRNQAVIFETYISSPTAELELEGNIKRNSAFARVRPWYINGADIPKKHVASPHLYMLSFASPPPEEVTLGGWTGPWYARWYNPLLRVKTGRVALSAATSDWYVREMMHSGNHWDQVEGRYTPGSYDDQYQRK